MILRSALLLALLAPSLRADVQPSSLFSDHMVLQQGQPVPIWGTAAPGEEVTVEFAGQKKSTAAAADGKWQVDLAPLALSTESRNLTIHGKNTATISDVLVGEVWLCAGQSNMAMSLMEADKAPEEIKKPDSLLRAFRVPERPGSRPWDTVNGEWIDFGPKTGSRWSAMPYFFGQRLRGALHVPIGLVVCAWGGSSGVGWSSEEALAPLKPLVPEDVFGWRSNIQPTKLYNGMLHPLAPLAIAGVVWYQGETEGEPQMNAYNYRFIFSAMIRDWRKLWNRPELPFYWVQLPNLRKNPSWAIVRESQTEALKLPHTGMIPTIDIGQETQLHPKNKWQFGARLGDLVLDQSYQKGTWPGAPTYQKMEVSGDTIRLTFRDAKGLKTTDSQTPKSFLIAGEDQKFQPAEAKIDGDAVVVSAAAVKSPKAVRYAWDGNPPVNLANAAGLPLVPFRTDTWPVDGQQRHWQSLPEKNALPSSANGGQLARNESPQWAMALDGMKADDLEKFRVLRIDPKLCQMALSNLRRGSMTVDSPAVYWATTAEAAKAIDATKGITAQVTIQMYRATDAFRGFDLEIGLKTPEGKFRRYLISTVPMKLFAFQENEIHVLDSNLDNGTDSHTYRVAIRPDGVAQVYFDGKTAGLFEGEIIEKDPPSDSYIHVGKQVEAGEFTANFIEASFDTSGAFSGH